MALKTALNIEVEIEYTMLDETALRGVFLPKMVDITSVTMIRHQRNGKPKQLDILRFIPESQLMALEDEIMEKHERGEL